MKFDTVSDLHIEFNERWSEAPNYDGVSSFYPWHREAKSDILVIAGDCSNNPYSTMAVIDEACDAYKHVLFVDGNHEHYTGRNGPLDRRGTVGRHCNLFRKFADSRFKVTYLDGDSSFLIDGTLFCGVNGWYDWTAHSWTSREQQFQFWKAHSNDSRMIEYDRDGFPDKMARRQSEKLRETVMKAQDDPAIQQIVVVTHTIPHRVGMVPDNHAMGYLNGSYMNTTMQAVWMADPARKIKAWVFGHTHFHCDSDAEGIRFINNARGYYAYRTKSESGYVGLKQIDLESKSAFEVD